MDDMTTPGPNHPANRGIKDRSANSNRVVDLESYRNNRSIGVSKATSQKRSTYDSPELTKHEDEAIALGNSWKKPTMGEKLTKGAQWLGIIE